MQRQAQHDAADHDDIDLSPQLLDLEQVARLCQFSPRHVLRMAEAGRMPAPVKVGRCARWSRRTIQNWITAGCPHVTTTTSSCSVPSSRPGRPHPRTRPD